MKKLTREQALFEHRKMWNWIADETLKRKVCVTKEDYFETFKNEYSDKIESNCWCCEYIKNKYGFRKCSKCIIDWNKCGEPVSFICMSGLFGKWFDLVIIYYKSNDYEKASDLARQIASLPESILT